MAKAKKRKNTIISETAIKSINFFGQPNVDKRSIFLRAQKLYADAMNNFCSLLTQNNDYYWQILNNRTHSTELRSLEKKYRIKELGSVLSQNAFDDVVNKLYNREQNIKSEVNSYIHNEFTKNITVYYCMVLDKTKFETIDMVASFLKTSIQSYKESESPATSSKINYYWKLKRLLYMTPLTEFNSIKDEVRFWHESFSLEYKMPCFKKPFMRVDSRSCELEISKNIVAPFVLRISNPFVRGEKVEIPLNTTSVVERRYSMYKPANSLNIRVLDNGTLRVIGSVTKSTHYKESDLFIGCDTGITDALYLSDGKGIGTFKDVIDYNINVVEPAEAQNLRNKLRKVRHFYRTHKKSLSPDAKSMLIRKMNCLNKMIQQNKAARHRKNYYHAMLDKRIKDIIKAFLKHIKKRDVTVVLERLDIKEFNSSKKSNALRSVFARGKFQKRFLEQLAWYGIKFVEVDPTYTSSVCPICFNLDKKNRNNKVFKCTCCGFKGDADFVASINIKDRAINPELKKIEAANPYSRNKRKISFEKYFADKNAEYLRESLSA